MGFCWPHSLLSCSWTPDSWKNEFLKLSGLVAACCCQHHCLRYIDSWTFMNQCNVDNGADSNKLRLVRIILKTRFFTNQAFSYMKAVSAVNKTPSFWNRFPECFFCVDPTHFRIPACRRLKRDTIQFSKLCGFISPGVVWTRPAFHVSSRTPIQGARYVEEPRVLTV